MSWNQHLVCVQPHIGSYWRIRWYSLPGPIPEWNRKLDIQNMQFCGPFRAKKIPPCLNSYLLVLFFWVGKTQRRSKKVWRPAHQKFFWWTQSTLWSFECNVQSGVTVVCWMPFRRSTARRVCQLSGRVLEPYLWEIPFVMEAWLVATSSLVIFSWEKPAGDPVPIFTNVCCQEKMSRAVDYKILHYISLGGFEYFLFSSLLGGMIQFDKYFSEGIASNQLQPCCEQLNHVECITGPSWSIMARFFQVHGDGLEQILWRPWWSQTYDVWSSGWHSGLLCSLVCLTRVFQENGGKLLGP